MGKIPPLIRAQLLARARHNYDTWYAPDRIQIKELKSIAKDLGFKLSTNEAEAIWDEAQL